MGPNVHSLLPRYRFSGWSVKLPPWPVSKLCESGTRQGLGGNSFWYQLGDLLDSVSGGSSGKCVVPYSLGFVSELV